jgi:hypothetical protein
VPPTPRNLLLPSALITCDAIWCAWMNPEAIFAFGSSTPPKLPSRSPKFDPLTAPQGYLSPVLLQCASVTSTEIPANPAHSCEASGLLGAPNANPCLCNTLSQITCTPCPGEGQRSNSPPGPTSCSTFGNILFWKTFLNGNFGSSPVLIFE